MVSFHLRAPEPLEKDIQSAILEYLQRKKVFCWKEHSAGIPMDNGKRFMPIGLKGKSDILGITKDGRFLAIEVKRPTGRTSPAQEEFLRNVSENGGLAFVARSVDDVIEKGL